MASSNTNAIEMFLRLIPSSDLASARLRLEPGLDLSGIRYETVMAYLNEKAVSRDTIDPDSIVELLGLAQAQPDETHIVQVCTARPPVPGENGHFELIQSVQQRVDKVKARERLLRSRLRQNGLKDEADPSDLARPAKNDPVSPSTPTTQEQVDFYNQSAFVIANEGDELGRIIEPTLGTPGVDIFGKVISTRAGRSAEVKFEKSVRVDEDGRVFAQCSGKLVCSLTTVLVEPILEVESSVSFVTGNIDFPGDVNISMGVKDRFVVRATGNLAIRELVQACTLETGGDCHLVVGIAGRDAAKIRIGGDLSARYIEACTGTVCGNAEITGEITHGDLRIEGHLLSPTCTVRGGELTVAGRVMVSTLGSENGSPTVLRIGSLAGLEQILGDALEIGPRLAGSVDRINTRLETAREFEPTDAQTESMIEHLETQLATNEKDLHLVADAVDRILGLAQERTEVHLMVRKIIHPGTSIITKGWRIEFEQRVLGPILITVDQSGLPMATAPGETIPKPLARFARVIEDHSSIRIEVARGRAEKLRTRFEPPSANAA